MGELVEREMIGGMISDLDPARLHVLQLIEREKTFAPDLIGDHVHDRLHAPSLEQRQQIGIVVFVAVIEGEHDRFGRQSAPTVLRLNEVEHRYGSIAVFDQIIKLRG